MADTQEDHLRVVVGTYDKRILGFDLEGDEFVPKFACPAHTGCVKSLTITGDYLVTGSSDESMRVYNIRKCREHGMLQHHTGSVSALDHFSKTHLLSASEDSTIALWRTKDWEQLTSLKGHKGPVYDLSVHPTGRLALSVGKDCTLRMWNLLKMRCAHTSKLGKEPADIVEWSPDGVQYAVVVGAEVRMYAVDGDLVQTLQHTRRVLTCKFLGDDILATGCDDGLIRIFDLEGGENTRTLKGHSNRVKAIHYFPERNILVSASSDSTVRAWDLNIEEDDECEIAKITTAQRLTCLTATTIRPKQAGAAKDKKDKKKKKVQVAVEKEEEAGSDAGSDDE